MIFNHVGFGPDRLTTTAVANTKFDLKTDLLILLAKILAAHKAIADQTSILPTNLITGFSAEITNSNAYESIVLMNHLI